MIKNGGKGRDRSWVTTIGQRDQSWVTMALMRSVLGGSVFNGDAISVGCDRSGVRSRWWCDLDGGAGAGVRQDRCNLGLGVVVRSGVVCAILLALLSLLALGSILFFFFLKMV